MQFVVELDRTRWTSDGTYWIRGRFRLDGTDYSGASALVKLSQISLPKCLEGASGGFAVVAKGLTGVTMISDRTRSFPMLFRRMRTGWIVSDSITSIRKDAEANISGFREYCATGFVTGEETLWDGVYQVQSGEIVHLGLDGPERNSYFKLAPSTMAMDRVSRADLLQDTLDTIFKRAVERLEGRPVAVLLSGGYDSRLVLQQLVRQGAERIHAVSFGEPTNKQVLAARDVASKLDVRWARFSPGRNFFRHWLKQPGSHAFLREAGAGVSTLYAMGLLMGLARDRHLIPRDAVVMTGSGGDILEGAQIDPIFFEGRNFSSEDIIGSVIEKHYMLMGRYFASNELFRERIRVNLNLHDGRYTSDEAVELCQRFNWRERQSKYVIQDARCYELLGMDYAFPLWEKEFIDFWLQVPLTELHERSFYHYFVRNEAFASANITSLKQKVTRALKRHAHQLIRTVYPLEKARQYFFADDPYNALGILDQLRLLSYTKGYRTTTVSGHIFYEMHRLYPDLQRQVLRDHGQDLFVRRNAGWRGPLPPTGGPKA